MKLLEVRSLSGLLYAVCLSACGDSPARTTNDPKPDAAVADADAGEVDAADASADAGSMSPENTGPEPLVANCPVRGQECGDWDAMKLFTILVASDYGAGAKFVTMNGAAVLLQTPDAGARVLRSGSGSGFPPPTPTQWRVPEGYDVLWLGDAAEDGVYLLGTAQADGALALFHGLEPLQGFEAKQPIALTPPPFQAAEIRGLLAREVDSNPQPCVYGKGLSCFDGSQWRQLIPTDVSLAAATFSWGGGLAVAEDGTLWFAASSGGTRPQLADFSALELQVPGVVRSIHNFNIVTDQGLYRVARSTGELAACADADPPLGVFSNRALYADGRHLVLHPSDGWCEVETLALSGPILKITQSTWSCGAGENALVLTEDILLGHVGCWD